MYILCGEYVYGTRHVSFVKNGYPVIRPNEPLDKGSVRGLIKNARPRAGTQNCRIHPL